MIKAKEKRERFLGEKLGLKGERGFSPKAAIIRKPYPPGQHGPSKKSRKLSEFARQIREKQKFKLSYGLTEKTMARLFVLAYRDKVPTAHKLMELMERRLDNVIFRLGLAFSRAQARGLIRQGHIVVNAKKTVSPGFLVSVNDVIGFRDNSKKKIFILRENIDFIKRYDPPAWLSLNVEKLEGQVLDLPREVDPPYEVTLLVQSFSK